MKGEDSNKCDKGKAMKHKKVESELRVFVAEVANDGNDNNGEEEAAGHEVAGCYGILTKSC